MGVFGRVTGLPASGKKSGKFEKSGNFYKIQKVREFYVKVREFSPEFIFR